MSEAKPVLIDGAWRAAQADGTFAAANPSTKESTGEVYPVSGQADVDAAVEAAAGAAEELAGMERVWPRKVKLRRILN